MARPKSLQRSLLLLFGLFATTLFLIGVQPPASWHQPLRSLTHTPTAKGGVIVFLHVPKTGGTTIRKTFSSLADFAGVYVNHQLDQVKQQVEEQLTTHSKNKALFVEIHDRSCSNLRELAPLLHQWRRLARANHKPFFAFTILRDPIDYAVSLFNFFHVVGGVFGHESYPRCNGTSANFQHVMFDQPKRLFNPQCLYLLKGELFNREVTDDDCQWVAQTLQETMDWVGNTKTMSQETLPHLNYLLTGQREGKGVALAYESKALLTRKENKPDNQLLKKSDLDSVSLTKILESSQMDGALIHYVTGDAGSFEGS